MQINLYSCSQSLENVQVFIATEDLQVGTNRFSIAVADKNGLVNSESLELNFSGEGGYPKFKKDFKFIKFPDYYDTDIVQEVHIGVVKSFLLEKKTDSAKEYWLNKGRDDVVNDQLIALYFDFLGPIFQFQTISSSFLNSA